MKTFFRIRRIHVIWIFLVPALLVTAGNKRSKTTMPPATVYADTVPSMQVDTLPPVEADTLHRSVFQVPPAILPIHHP